MTVPDWALSLIFWLHMLATIVWIGGLAALTIFVLPVAQKSIEASTYAAFLADVQKRLDPWAWFSLVMLAATGMVQMSANPNYQGFFAIENRWAVALLIKHVFFLGMVALSAFISWGLLPKIRRLALRQARIAESQEHKEALIKETIALHKQEARLIKINLFLGIVVLAMTAIARAAV